MICCMVPCVQTDGLLYKLTLANERISVSMSANSIPSFNKQQAWNGSQPLLGYFLVHILDIINGPV